jgi:hypothetical protein
MDIEIFGFLGFVFAATTLGAIAYEHRFHGSNLEGRSDRSPNYSARRLWVPSFVDRLRRSARDMSTSLG